MRIAIVAGPYIAVPPKHYGGTEQVIHYLIKGLTEAGHEPVLFAPGDSDEPCEIIPIVDKGILFPTKQSEVPAHNKVADRILKKTEKLLRENLNRFDIIHSHGFDLKNFQAYPNLTTLHNRISLDEMPYYEERNNLYFVSISKNQQEAFRDLQYIGVVYNGEDPCEFPVVTEPEDYVCFLGRYDEEKNPHLAIQLAISVGIKIKLAGKKDFRGERYFKEEIKPYLSHPLVENLGELDFNQKVDLISKAKCNLHPTGFREPFGLSVLEAAYCGTPTLAIELGSMPELIEEGHTGVLVEDFEEGYHHIKECFGMDREYIARRARRLFTYKTMTRQYLQAYNQVIRIFDTRRALAMGAVQQLEFIWQKDAERQKNGRA
jgi:glycosyltransferase involved in cell wall biosynthesis